MAFSDADPSEIYGIYMGAFGRKQDCNHGWEREKTESRLQFAPQWLAISMCDRSEADLSDKHNLSKKGWGRPCNSLFGSGQVLPPSGNKKVSNRSS